MISELPGRNVRPSTIFTCGLSVRPASPTPRITTLDGLPDPFLPSEISTTTSFDTSGTPSGPSATSGRLSSTAA
jgi:hypothetical protein